MKLLIRNYCNHIYSIQYLHSTFSSCNIYVTVFWKTDHLDTTTEIHLLPVRDIGTLMHYPETPSTRQ